MNTIQYRKHLSDRLIDRFKMEYYEKLGVVPLVTTKDKRDNTYPITLEELEAELNSLIPTRIKRLVPNITIRTRVVEIVRLRKIFAFVAYYNIGHTKTTIAKHLKQDHTTIVHHHKHFEDDLQFDKILKKLYIKVLQNLNIEPNVPELIQFTPKGRVNTEPVLSSVAHEESVSM